MYQLQFRGAPRAPGEDGVESARGPPTGLEGSRAVIARGRYYFNAPLLRVARGPPRQRRRLQNYTPDLVRLSPDLDPTF